MRTMKQWTAMLTISVMAQALLVSRDCAAETDSRLEPDLEKMLNEQVNAEFYSAYLYLSMAAHFESVDLQGFANWMRVQYQEETTHALMIFDYINDRNGRVKLTPIAAPKIEWASPLKAFRDAYEHEKHVSKLIHNLVNKSRQLSDNSTDTFLQWFVTEQIEEESNTYRVAQQLKLAGDDKSALLMLDRELARRVLAPAPAAPAP